MVVTFGAYFLQQNNKETKLSYHKNININKYKVTMHPLLTLELFALF